MDRTQKPLHKQLTAELRRLINGGFLACGARLPASRVLATTLKIARTTVIEAYEQLLMEGYLESQPGSGTFVASFAKTEQKQQKNDKKFQLSGFGQQLLEIDLISTCFGRPAVEHFPWSTWHRLLGKVNVNELGYPHPAGYWPLRQALAAYLNQSRGLRCLADQIIIVSGAQQGIELTGRLLLNENDEIAIEDPGYHSVKEIFQSLKAKIHPIPVDESGLIVEKLQKHKKIKLIYTTPSHQFPTGAVMSLSRRQDLLCFASKNSSLIIEDDYSSEFRYQNAPLPALQGLDETGSVIYLGSFSKILLPGLRIGYLVVPNSLIDIFIKAKRLIDSGSSIIEQIVLVDFINQEHLSKHIKKMRKIYSAKKTRLIDHLQNKFGENIKIIDYQAGLHLMVEAKIDISSELDGLSWSELAVCSLNKHKTESIFRFLVGFSDFSKI